MSAMSDANQRPDAAVRAAAEELPVAAAVAARAAVATGCDGHAEGSTPARTGSAAAANTPATTGARTAGARSHPAPRPVRGSACITIGSINSSSRSAARKSFSTRATVHRQPRRPVQPLQRRAAGLGANVPAWVSADYRGAPGAGSDQRDPQAGSAFFMPAGTWHTTAGQQGESLSVIVVVRAPSRLALVLNLLRHYAPQSPEWRTRSYGGWAPEGAAMNAEREKLTALIADLAKRLPSLPARDAYGAWLSEGFTTGALGPLSPGRPLRALRPSAQFIPTSPPERPASRPAPCAAVRRIAPRPRPPSPSATKCAP
jgi:hypothetical protein